MSIEAWSAIASWVATIVAIGSLFIIIIQLRDVKNSQHSGAISQLYDSYIELDRFFIDHPDFRPYVYGKIEQRDITPEIYNSNEALAEMVTDILYKAFNQKLVLEPADFENEVNYMRDLFKSPLMSTYLQLHQRWYNEKFVTHMGIQENK